MASKKKSTPSIHPVLDALEKQRSEHKPTFVLRGFVAPAPRGSVGLSPDLSLAARIEVHGDDIVRCDEDPDSGMTTLFIAPSAIVTAVAVRQLPIATAARDNKPGGGSGSTVSDCVEKKIKECKSDPMRADKTFCDTKDAKDLYETLCKIFPQSALSVGITIA